jgi:plasmid stability protein
MRQLLVRGVEDGVVAALRARAARNGRSVEAEHRELLREALLPRRRRKSLKEHLLSIPEVGEEGDFARPSETPRRVRL